MNWNDIESTKPGLSVELERQVKVGKLVGFGFALTLADRSGFSAPIAVVFGLRALFLIHSSEAAISGNLMAWWCILVGSLNGVFAALNLLALLAAHYQR
jgi:hypothetical protein